MLFIRRSVNYGTLLKNNKITTLFTRQGRIATTLSNLYFSSSKPAEKMKFKAETKKLLNIVAKSLYTDSQVFLKQLLSNASDSLQKQRFISQTNDGLVVNIEISSTKNQLIIQDNGIGMSRQDLINNLGTIAKSGSKQFLQKMKNKSRKIQKNIIGQFGVGFYSSFIVADHVQVISKMAGQPANKWSSDGDGTFKIQQVEQSNFERGTKIILHIKPQHKKYLDKVTIQKIIQNYSQFINYPIFINKEAINLIKALWAREKKDISDKQYQDFYQFLTEKTNKYQYKMHFSSDTPLHIKSLLFIPQNHSQTFDKEEKKEISLYCKKVLIQKNCKQLLPNFLRFVKGVVDCEDIPLNISRQKYQDSALMNKLKDFLTKKVLKSLKDQADKDPITYNKWYSEFELFIKQGSFNNQYRKQVYPLNRYGLNTLDGQFSLKDYISLKKPEQDRIFYFCAKNKYQAKDSLYVNPLTQAGIPVVIAYNNIDQIIFINMDTYEGLKFSNVETDTQSVQKILQLYRNKETQSIQNSKKVKQEQFVQFSNWIKQELQPFVNKVNISKRGIKMPAMVFSPISSSLRQIQFIQRLKQNQKFEQSPQIFQNLTLQYDPSNPIMIKLNNLRKSNQEKASLILQQIFDNSCIQAGLQINFNKMANRLNVMMAKFIEDEFKKNL